jgi:hypothetical protein
VSAVVRAAVEAYVKKPSRSRKDGTAAKESAAATNVSKLASRTHKPAQTKETGS